MNITEEILACRGRFTIDLVAHYIGSDAQRFAQLMELVFTKTYPIPERAAWIMTACFDSYPFLLDNYVDRFVDLAFTITNQSVLRSIMYVLASINLTEQHAGRLYDWCIEMLFSKRDIAVRAYSMQVLFNVAKQQPALQPELRLLLADVLRRGDSKGMEAKARKLLAMLK